MVLRSASNRRCPSCGNSRFVFLTPVGGLRFPPFPDWIQESPLSGRWSLPRSGFYPSIPHWLPECTRRSACPCRRSLRVASPPKPHTPSTRPAHTPGKVFVSTSKRGSYLLTNLGVEGGARKRALRFAPCRTSEPPWGRRSSWPGRGRCGSTELRTTRTGPDRAAGASPTAGRSSGERARSRWRRRRPRLRVDGTCPGREGR